MWLIKILLHTFRCLLSTEWMTLRDCINTMYFNFKYLPIQQAYRLPIFLHNVNANNFHGKIILNTFSSAGRIILGRHHVLLYEDTGITLSGAGTIMFNGSCHIGSGTYISVGMNGCVEFGDYFFSTQGLRLACEESIVFDNHVLVGWECTILDTDYHCLVNMDGEAIGSKTQPVKLGNDCWLAHGCTILKGTSLPHHTSVAAKSLVKPISIPAFCLIGGTPAKKLKEGVKLET